MFNMVNANDEYKLTIIMSNYNQAKFLKRAIESVKSQLVEFKYKIIIVDDNSTKDDSVEVIRAICKENKNVKAIFGEENKGYLTNVLRAKKITKTEYFCLLDADDYWTDNSFLQRAVDFLDNNIDYVIYESNVNVLYKDLHKKRYINRKVCSCSFSKDDIFDGKSVPITQTTGMIFRNVIFKNGIPEIMENAIGTVSERSFEGDYDRFMMHIRYGKAFYDRTIVGVYDASMGGIWSDLPNTKKYLISGQSFVDYWRFFQEGKEYFVAKTSVLLLEYYIHKIIEMFNGKYTTQEKDYEMLRNIESFCQCNEEVKLNMKMILLKIVFKILY